uniref:T cell activation RhoGTPase activating protein b n=1 Tax=Amphilophus citrinellus TaxID=61819 RepID=A0A3Q0SAV6_AMPCI
MDKKFLLLTETKWNVVRRRLSKGRKKRPETENKTQLFGQPLRKICPDDCSLPKPVTVSCPLTNKGPSTEGVFRKPCNSKSMKDIREQLNSGVNVDMGTLPVVLLVGLLKSFLKELPGSLLVSDLYDKWMAALDNEDTQQRAVEITKVVDDLPGLNRLLLQHLICIFHHILESADINKMDAHNLAVCIGPTLLQLDDTPLEQQKEKMQKVKSYDMNILSHFLFFEASRFRVQKTSRSFISGSTLTHTQVLITNYSVSSQHQDSAYDSTDQDGDGEAGESNMSTPAGSTSSSSSPSPSTTTPTWSDATFSTKSGFDRRSSEPIILLSDDLKGLCSHARSHEDCSTEKGGFGEQPLKKQISDDSFLLRGRGGARPVLSFSKLNNNSNGDLQPFMGKDCSCSSLDSTTSNHSECSVFTSSPMVSPGCSRKANTSSQPSVVAKGQHDINKPEEKRRSQSMRITPKVLLRTRSLGAFSRSSQKKDSQKENSFPCETLQEDLQSEADPPAELLNKPRPLSAIEVFKHVDSRQPCSPPSYEQAVQNVGPPPRYRSMTVKDAIEVEMRSRPSSVNYDFPATCSFKQFACSQDSFGQEANVVELRQPFRQRAMSESVSTRQHDALSRRCSQPVFEELSYAKESYV